jgi:hypothetical protein
MGSYIEIDPEQHEDATPNEAWLEADERDWLAGSVEGSEPSDVKLALRVLAARLADERKQTTRQLDVLRLNMVQQQAYHRLLGQVYAHHRDCDSCAPLLRMMGEMIAQNIEHLDSLLPEEERSGAAGAERDE